MKIIFDLRGVGLGNNGGSSTLVKSANILNKLGHKVTLVDHSNSFYTWTPLYVEHIIVKRDLSMLPSSDIIIATGYKSVKYTIDAPKRCGIKGHWIRGWETWQMPSDQIVKQVLRARTIKFVNGICLKDKLKTFGFNSYLVRPGYDLEELYPTGVRHKNSKFIIGGLYTTGKHTDIKRYGWILEVSRYMKKKYSNVELWLMGTSKQPLDANKYYRQPTIEQKNEFYNGVDIWLSPSRQEGLHMPPAEAMMTCCPVVGNSSELNGTNDYLIDNYSGLVAKDDYNDFRDCVEKLYLQKEFRITLGENAKKVISSIGSREKNMTEFVQLIRRL